MNEAQAMVMISAIGELAKKSLDELSALLSEDAGYEPKMNFFMAFLTQLIDQQADRV